MIIIKNFFPLFLALIFVACLNGHKSHSTLVVKNNSMVSFDSAVVMVNEMEMKCGALNSGDSIKRIFLKDSAASSHDVTYSFRLYKGDSLMVKYVLYSNDLGFVPNECAVMITDTLSIVRYR